MHVSSPDYSRIGDQCRFFRVLWMFLYLPPITYLGDKNKLAFKSFQPKVNGSPFDLLSEREIQIALMIANCQKVQAISDKLCLSPKTVNTYRYRIYEKLSITSDVELALLAVRHGMVDTITECVSLVDATPSEGVVDTP